MNVIAMLERLEDILEDDGNLICNAQDGLDPSDPAPIKEIVVKDGQVYINT